MEEEDEDELSDTELDCEELPDGWEEGVSDEGKVYYVCHTTRTTQWSHPKTHRMRVLSKTLPDGWIKRDDGTFFDTVNSTQSRTDPRLLRAPKASEFVGSRERISDDGKGIVRTVRDTFKMNHTADDVLLGVKLDGKVAIVTGANSGLGFETARSLAHHGAHVVLACRCLHEGHVARQKIYDERPGCLVEVMELDLASSQSVRIFADDFRRKQLPLHILVCNAAVLGLDYQAIDGMEAHFTINHLSHFLLVRLLTPVLLQSAPCRVIVVSSEAHRQPSLSSQQPVNARALIPSAADYWPICAYNTSKLCGVLFMRQLHALHSHQGIFCNAVHPGNTINTSLSRHSWILRALCTLSWPFSRSPAQAAAGIVYCAASVDLEHVGGYYFVDNKVCNPSPLAQDPQLAEDLWALSEHLTNGSKEAI